MLIQIISHRLTGYSNAQQITPDCQSGLLRSWQSYCEKAVHWCLVNASLYADWIFIGKNGGAHGCCQLVWHSSTEEQGRQFTLNTAAVHWCLVTAHLYAEWIFIGVNAVAQGCCQLVWHSSTEEEGRQFTLNTAAVHWCLVTANLYAV